MRDLKYLAAYIIPTLAIIGLHLGGTWTYGAMIFAFGFVPVVEPFLPNSTYNHPELVKTNLSKKQLFDWLLYLNVPIVFFIIGYFVYTLNTSGLSTYEYIGNILSVGTVIGACGINVAHELGHRNQKGEQLLAKLLLLPALYMHFFIEHNRGHHKHVATDKDPASARRNEHLYAFWFRSVVWSYRSAWRLETERLRKANQSFWSGHNEMLVFQFAQAVFLLVIYLTTDGWGFLAIVSSGVFGFLLLETINYIEHYGLRRQLLESGRYERVRPIHSWNSNFELGRIVLYELTRHSDHHFIANKKYQLLDHHEHAPQLPLGYPASMLLSLFPPAWFYLMNRRLPKEV